VWPLGFHVIRETSNGAVLNDLVARPAGTPQDFPGWQGPFLVTLRSSLEIPDGSVAALGQSGHRFSPHRTDQLRDWREGRTHPWGWGGPPPGFERGRLTLVPAWGGR
jgi:acyl-homoserine lactone acylase PvdQ